MRTKAIFAAMLLALAPLPSVAQNIFLGFDAYERGDYATALRVWKPLAEQGDAVLQYRLGIMYNYGQGVARDYAEAARWYRAAARQGHAEAQKTLGLFYLSGLGVLQDFIESVRWYRAAAKQGNSEAQTFLGLAYIRGEGVMKDYILAHMWLNIAAVNGYNEAVEGREILADLMSSTDIHEAQRRARVCMASSYQDCD